MRRQHLPWCCALLSLASLCANHYATLRTSRSNNDRRVIILQSPPPPLLPSPLPPSPSRDGLESLAVWLGGSGTPLKGCPDDCFAQAHADLWGQVVGTSGAKSIQPTAADCCASCKAHASAARAANTLKRCNTWVHCGNESACGAQFGHCWLKRQPDPMHTPAVSALGWSWGKLVPWTAGILLATNESAAVGNSSSGGGGSSVAGSSRGGRNGQQSLPTSSQPPPYPQLALETSLGLVRIRLALARSPNATRWLLQRASAATTSPYSSPTTSPSTSPSASPTTSPSTSPTTSASPCSTCRFYRAEPVPLGWGKDWFFGPPYALLQGSFGGAASHPFPLAAGKEGGLVLRRGSLILIDKGPDFLIGLAPCVSGSQSLDPWAASASLLLPLPLPLCLSASASLPLCLSATASLPLCL